MVYISVHMQSEGLVPGHAERLKLFPALNVDGKHLRIIKKLYWGQKAVTRCENELASFVKIKRGVRQGRTLSPERFSCIVDTS